MTAQISRQPFNSRRPAFRRCRVQASSTPVLGRPPRTLRVLDLTTPTAIAASPSRGAARLGLDHQQAVAQHFPAAILRAHAIVLAPPGLKQPRARGLALAMPSPLSAQSLPPPIIAAITTEVSWRRHQTSATANLASTPIRRALSRNHFQPDQPTGEPN